MNAQVVKKTKDGLLVRWECQDKGFGELTMVWDNKQQRFVLDSEMMGVEFVLEVFKACQVPNTLTIPEILGILEDSANLEDAKILINECKTE